MTSLRERIFADLTVAIRAQDEAARETLRMVKSELVTHPDADALEVVQRGVKTRRESAAQYEAGGREDLAAVERAQIAVLERYLPKQLDEAAAREAVRAVIDELGATSKRDLGRVMKTVLERHKGELDGKLASRLAAELLS
ncbi:MAG: GatB/YqeY domain-containing protein [Myxococcales bacterium]|nr:GatB/YqeY domain-containing protein [Myxococcales bacterium]